MSNLSGDELTVCRRCEQRGATCVRPGLNIRFRPQYDLEKVVHQQVESSYIENIEFVDESDHLVEKLRITPPDTDIAPSSGSVTRPAADLSHSETTISDTQHDLQGAAHLVEHPAQQQAVLIRHFIQELAPWFDVCDASRQFSTIVPVRALQSRTLLCAVLTASARHLVRIAKYKGTAGPLTRGENGLVDIGEELAVQYQNECIRNLLQYSRDTEQTLNEDLLAASIILRTDEEMEFGETLEDKQIFLKVTSAFMRIQVPTPESPMMLPSLPSPANTGDYQMFGLQTVGWGAMQTEGLRQACFWVAFRQELHAAITQQRPLYVSLAPYRDFLTFTEAPDTVWAHRLAIYCAELVEHCFGGIDTNTNRQVNTTWETLKSRVADFESSLPTAFGPIYRCEHPDPDIEEFPEIWYINSEHATGAAYFELARILLYAFEVKHPLGLGYRSWLKNMRTDVRLRTKRLCGIALHNRQAPPLFLNACSAIEMCGEHFEEAAEQEAILGFLYSTEKAVGYPTQHLASKLRQAWSSHE